MDALVNGASDPDLAALVRDLNIPVIRGEKLDALKKIDEGTTSAVSGNTRTGAVYKLVRVDEGKVKGFIPRNITVRPADDVVVISGDREHALIELLRAVAISNAHGSPVFTEIAGVTEEGDLVLKQPFIRGFKHTDTQDEKEVAAILKDLGLSQITDIGARAAIGRIGNRVAIFDDLHGANIGRDRNERPVLLDSLAARLLSPGEVTLVEPYAKPPLGRASTEVTPPTFQEVAYDMPVDAPVDGELLPIPKDIKLPKVMETFLRKASEKFGRIFGTTITAVDGRKIKIQRFSKGREESLEETFGHLTRFNDLPGRPFNPQKIRSVGAVEQTLKKATVRLRDADNGTLHYLRRIGKDEWHTVVVRPDGTLDDQTVTTRLATQFVLGNQDRVFRLPVDQEEKGFALWRIDNPLVQSGEPRANPQREDTTGGRNVQGNLEGRASTDITEDPLADLNPGERAHVVEVSPQFAPAPFTGRASTEMTVNVESPDIRFSTDRTDDAGEDTGGFEPTVFSSDDRAFTNALRRARNIPAIEQAMRGRTYFAWAEADTHAQAESYLDDPKHQGDSFRAALAVDAEWGVPFEQKILVKAIAIKRHQAAIAAANARLAQPESPENNLVGVRMLRDKMEEEHDNMANRKVDQSLFVGGVATTEAWNCAWRWMDAGGNGAFGV